MNTSCKKFATLLQVLAIAIHMIADSTLGSDNIVLSLQNASKKTYSMVF